MKEALRGRGRGRGGGFAPEELAVQVAQDRTAEEKFRKENPPMFDGLGDPADAEKWIKAVERIFNYIRCDDREKVICATYQLVEEADFWWESVRRTMTDKQWENITWDEFKTELYEKYIPGCYRQKKQNEFWNQKQRAGTVTEYDRAFNQLSRYAPHLVDIDEKRAEKFRNGLRHEISISLASQGDLTYAQTLSRALTIESLLPKEKGKTFMQFDYAQPRSGEKGKRKWENKGGGNLRKVKQPWRENRLQEQGQVKERPQCPTCRRNHFGECRKGPKNCFECNQPGHFARDCPNQKENGGLIQQQEAQD